MTKAMRGTIHGRTIQLADDPGIAEGLEVEIQVKVVSNATSRSGEGFLRSEGALEGDEEWDAVMEEIHHARKAAL